MIHCCSLTHIFDPTFTLWCALTQVSLELCCRVQSGGSTERRQRGGVCLSLCVDDQNEIDIILVVAKNFIFFFKLLCYFMVITRIIFGTHPDWYFHFYLHLEMRDSAAGLPRLAQTESSRGKDKSVRERLIPPGNMWNRLAHEHIMMSSREVWSCALVLQV